MDDLKAVVPYHDPHDNDTVVLSEYLLSDIGDDFGIDELLNSADNADCIDINLNPSNDTYVQEILDEFIDAPIDNHSFDANMLWDGEQQPVQTTDICNNIDPKLPLMESNAPFSCDFCDLLQEMIHTDGIEVSRLEIHGISGMIDHAILRVHSCPDSIPVCEFINLCNGDTENVMQTLERYNEDRRLAGFALVEDRAFYPNTATNINAYENLLNEQNDTHQSSVNVGRLEVEPSEQQQHVLDPAVAVNKTALALQRERSSRMTLDDFVDYFHLPIEKAAKELGVCATVVKKICRKHGLVRWPHRKIKSLKRRLETLKLNMETVRDGRDKGRIEREINHIVQQIDQVRSAAAAGQL